MQVSWLKSIRDWQEEFVGNMSSREFVDTVTGDLLSSRVFVFTPKGEVMILFIPRFSFKYLYKYSHFLLQLTFLTFALDNFIHLRATNVVQVKNLPKGATVIDYAYQIHTDVGNKMVAAKVKQAPIDSPLYLSLHACHTLPDESILELQEVCRYLM